MGQLVGESMHPYATDSRERERVFLGLAALAVGAAWLLSRILVAAEVSAPWWLDAPSTMGFYGIFFSCFDRVLWRHPALHRFGIVKVPVLEGLWKGELRTSFDEHAARHDVDVQIQQTWTRIGLGLRGKDSASQSVAATILTESPDGVVLNYQYRNEPLSHAIDSMQIHYGTAKLILENNVTLSGEYYSGRGRQNFGAIRLRKA